MCLIIKSGSKVVKISTASYENEIHRADSPFKEDFKNYNFCQVRPNFGGGTARKFKENDQKREVYCYANEKVVNSNREYWPLLPGIKIFALCMLDQIIRKKLKKSVFRQNFAQSLRPSPPQSQRHFPNFDNWAIVLCLFLSRVKIFFFSS